MISIHNNTILYENALKRLFQSNESVISDLLQTDDVKKFITLSKTFVTKEGLSTDQQSEFNKLLDTKDVTLYLQRIDTEARKFNMINGSIYGLLPGIISGALIGNAIGLPVAAMALLGGVVGGWLTGELLAKVKSIFQAWNNKTKLRRQNIGINTIEVTKKRD